MEKGSDSIEFLFPRGEDGLRVSSAVDIQVHIPALIDLIPQHRVAVQAGGAVGVWPRVLASVFETVYTFEPNAALFHLLVANTRSTPNVIRMQAALGTAHAMCSVQGEARYANNMGAWRTHLNEGVVPVLLIDDLALPVCDLIALDVEGAEWSTLGGARNTITAHHPTICIEDKGIGSPKGQVPGWLIDVYGYRVVAQLGNDVVLQ